MKKLWQLIGIAVYWLTVPGIWLLLRRTRRCRIVIQHGNSVVVVKPWLGNGKWCLPGGGVHKRESAREAVGRETKEETGLNLTTTNYHDHGSQLYHQNGLTFAYQLFSVKADAQLKIKKQKLEIVEAAWVPIGQLNAQTANQDVLTGLKSAK